VAGLAASGAVTAGIRPESVFLVPPGSRIEKLESAECIGRMQVTLVEEVGNSKLVTVRRGDWQVVGMTIGSGTLTPGQELDVMIDTKSTHWFDGKTGRALAHGVPSG